MEFRKVLAKAEGTLYVSIPKHSEINLGDYVMIKKIIEKKEVDEDDIINK